MSEEIFDARAGVEVSVTTVHGPSATDGEWGKMDLNTPEGVEKARALLIDKVDSVIGMLESRLVR